MNGGTLDQIPVCYQFRFNSLARSSPAFERSQLNFQLPDLIIIIGIVALAVLGLATYKFRRGTKSKEAGIQFLGMGIIWVLIGLVYSFSRGGNPFDIGLFNLGLIFACAGCLQLLFDRTGGKT